MFVPLRWFLPAALLVAACSFDAGGVATDTDSGSPEPPRDAASHVDGSPTDGAAYDAHPPAIDAAALPDANAIADAPVAACTSEPADCADPACDGRACGDGCVCIGDEATEVTCEDGADNDDDTLVDCRDGDCPGCPPLTMCCPDGACELIAIGCL